MTGISDCLEVQLSSAKLLNFCVNDMISLAQINSNKFRKEVSCFDIQKAVSEVMLLQKDKVNYLGVQMKTSFIGFDDSFMICTDQYGMQ